LFIVVHVVIAFCGIAHHKQYFRCIGTYYGTCTSCTRDYRQQLYQYQVLRSSALIILLLLVGLLLAVDKSTCWYVSTLQYQYWYQLLKTWSIPGTYWCSHSSSTSSHYKNSIVIWITPIQNLWISCTNQCKSMIRYCSRE
jgi:hypothetical protein